MDEQLAVHFLGEARYLYRGAALPFVALPKSTPLLAYLLMHRGEALQRERLAFLFWPDDQEGDALSNLRRHLHRIAGALPPAPADLPWLLATRTTVTFNERAPVFFDVTEYERLVRDDATLGLAAELYRGDFLLHSYDDWVIAERERLRTLHAETLARLIADARRERDYARALAYVTDAQRLDPLGEHTLRTALLVLSEYGDRAAAIAEYERFAERLRRELDAVPMPESVALYERIVRQTPGAFEPADGSRTHSPAGTREQLPFVGRAEALERLERAWSRAARGHGSTVVIGGEAGIGKTRLVSELVQLAERQGASVFSGTTAPSEMQPYQPFSEALRDALPVLLSLEIETVWLASLASLIPELPGRRPGLESPPVLDERRDRARLFEAVARCFEVAAHARPRVVVLEDLHWADPSTVALWEHAARRLANVPLLLIATMREEEVGLGDPLRSALKRLQYEQLAEELSLGPLHVSDVIELIERLPAALRISAPPPEILHSESEGNPLFVGLKLENAATGARSETIAAALATRFERLSEDARGLAEAAAVLGHGFDVDVLCELCGWHKARVLDGLDELLARRLIGQASAAQRTDYAFSHHLISQHVYREIASERRTRAHRRAARVLSRVLDEHGERFALNIAHHADQGGLHGEAAAYYRRAARYAQSVFANDEALRSALRAADLGSTPSERLEAWLIVEELHGRLGNREEQESALEEIDRLAGEDADGAAEFEAMRRRVALLNSLGRCEAEARAVARLEQLANAKGAVEHSDALFARARYAQSTGALKEAAAAASEAATGYVLGSSAQRAVTALTLAANVEATLGQFERARSHLERAEQVAAGVADAVALATVASSRATIDFIARDFERARAAAQEVLAACERFGDRTGAADAHSRLAAIAARRFEYDEARDHYALAVQTYLAIGDARGQAIVSLNAAVLDFVTANFGLAAAKFVSALELFTALGDLRGETLAASNSALSFTWDENHATAADFARRALALSERLQSPVVHASVLANCGRVALNRGEVETALGFLELALNARRETPSKPDLCEDLGVITEAYLACGRDRDALASAEELAATLPGLAEALFFPQLLWWTAARAFERNADTRAGGARRTAADLLLQRASRMAAADRLRYEALPLHREIAASVP